MVENLQEKYNKLTEKLNKLNIDNARNEAQLEAYNKEHNEVITEILSITNTTNLEDAQKKFELLEKAVADILAKAEELLQD